MRLIVSATFVALLFLPAMCLAEETRPPQPQPPRAKAIGPAEAEKPHDDGDIDVHVTPGEAEIRVWRTRTKGWVRVKKVELAPANARTAGLPYKHDLFGQYFEWAKGEKPPAQDVIFVIIQQAHPIAVANPKTKIVFFGTCTHFHHFLVDPKTGKVVKEQEGANQVFGPVPKPPAKEKPKPKKKPRRAGPVEVA
jgi:hypothetical protein